MATAKTWIWIIVGFLLVCLISLFVIAGAGVYYVSKHIDTQQVTGPEAMREFDLARARLKDQKPLIEIDENERPRATRSVRDMPTSAIKPANIHVMAWDPSDERIVNVTMPFWVLKIGGRKRDFGLGANNADLQKLIDLDVVQLERIGPVLIVDARSRNGDRVLVWTQ